MREKLLTLLLLGALFLGVGEWRGWFLGVPSQTPVFVYKKDYVASAARRTINRDDLPFSVSGDVQRGDVTVVVYFERPYSFQTNQAAQPERKVFERTFSEGQRLDLAETIRQGRGIYRVELAFEDATGLFRMTMPTSAEL